MFESAELGHTIDKPTWKAEAPKLREALLRVQGELLEKKPFSVLIIVSGVDGAGKGETINLLNAWMDPRHIETHAFGPGEDDERPAFYRYWKTMPPKGKIAVFFGSWYTAPIIDRVYGDCDEDALDRRCDEIARLERMLADEGVLLVKFWMHLSKREQKKRLKSLEKDPATAWRVTDTDWKHFKLYDSFRDVSARVLRRTSTAEAPWLVVEGADARYRGLTVGNALYDALSKRLAVHAPPSEPTAPPTVRPIDGRELFNTIAQPQPIDPAEYDERLGALEGRLNRLSRKKRFHKHAALCVFEGMDAAGKGGAIRTVTGALDARVWRITPFAAPTDEERARPYLWRFWRHVPKKGQFALFDRSWYGRVLVERIEGFASEPDWMRAYAEINDFEEQLAGAGVLLCKFWLHVSKEEQLRRFEQRQRVAYKQYKITDEDWRNRNKWDAYMVAAADMVDRTSTEAAPWTVVPADDKRTARLQVMQTLVDRVEEL